MAGVNSLIRAAVVMKASSQELVNVLYFKQLSAGGDMGGLSDAIKSTLYDVVKLYQSNAWKVDTITLTEQVVGGGAQLITTYGTVGTNAGTNQGLCAAACVSLRTTLAGRSHRGRQYLPMLSANAINDGLVIPAAVTALQNAYAAFKVIYGVGGTNTDYTWGIWSRKLGDIVTGGHITGYNVAAGFFPINAVHVDNVARVQRRREIGVGA